VRGGDPVRLTITSIYGIHNVPMHHRYPLTDQRQTNDEVFTRSGGRNHQMRRVREEVPCDVILETVTARPHRALTSILEASVEGPDRLNRN
jgi:hypothetical protein